MDGTNLLVACVGIDSGVYRWNVGGCAHPSEGCPAEERVKRCKSIILCNNVVSEFKNHSHLSVLFEKKLNEAKNISQWFFQ